MVVLGGEGSVAGPLLGGITLTVIPLFLSQTVSHGGAARSLIYGGLLLAVVLLVPGGMASLMGQLADRAKRLARRQPDTEDDQDTVASQPVDMPALREVIADVETPASLEVRGVSRSIGGLHILRDVSFAVTGGTIHGLIGPNGSGKTTLLNCISGLTKVDAGQVLVAGETMSGVASRNARAGIGRTFQTALLSEADSVRDNLMVGVDAHRKVPYVAYCLRLPPALKEARRTQAEVVRWASALGLEPLLDVRVSSLTPRQRRLVEIGRALATRPRVLLLDEPVAGLTGNEADELESLVRLLRSAGITVVLVEHHAELVMRLCDRVTVLDVGRILITDEPAKVSADASVVAAYLGDELTVSGAGID
jgi:branched-chain amino acid transport system permease protein